MNGTIVTLMEGRQQYQGCSAVVGAMAVVVAAARQWRPNNQLKMGKNNSGSGSGSGRQPSLSMASMGGGCRDEGKDNEGQSSSTNNRPGLEGGGSGGVGGVGCGWLLGLPTSIVRSMGRGIGRAIDVVISAYDGDDGDYYYSGRTMTSTMADATTDVVTGSDDENDDVSLSVVRRMLVMDVAYTPNIALDGGRNDVSDSRVERSDNDDVIDLMAVACACRDVLAYTRCLQEMEDGVEVGGVVGDGGGEEDRSPPPFFLVHDDPGRVMLG